MGVDFTAEVVVGFKGEIVPIIAPKTKYNEDTGEPYEVNEQTHRTFVVDGVTVADDKENCDVFCCGEGFEGLTMYMSGYEEGTRVLGVRLAKADQYDDCAVVLYGVGHPEVVNFTVKYGVRPSVYLLLSCG